MAIQASKDSIASDGLQTTAMIGSTIFRLALWAILFMPQQSAAQKESAQTLPDTSVRILGVPVFFYTPDTRFGGGAAGILSFRGEPLRSSITFSMAYTQRKQFLLWFPYQYFNKNGKWRAFGELGWFRYIFQYFGVGNNYANDYVEKYTAEFPRLRLSALRHISKGQYLGLRLAMDNYRIIEKEPGGDIDRLAMPGAGGGFSAAFGAVWMLDTRNSPFYPTQGWLMDVSLTSEAPQVTGSDFRYFRFTADVAHYWKLPGNVVFAAHTATDLTQGEAPFFIMPSLGGTKKLRGYFDGKFRDANMVLAQTELRIPLFWRFKAVAFGGVGAVWGRSGESAKARPNFGLGLRTMLDKKQQIHVRTDYGWGAGSSGFYLTVGEAF